MPYEMELLQYLDRYGGALNVLGRPLGKSEIRCMNIAQNIVNAYQEQNGAENIVEWTTSNPAKADLLHTAHTLAVELGLLKE